MESRQESNSRQSQAPSRASADSVAISHANTARQVAVSPLLDESRGDNITDTVQAAGLMKAGDPLPPSPPFSPPSDPADPAAAKPTAQFVIPGSSPGHVADNKTAFKPADENRTGMPDSLKSGIENLSGVDISDVRVHYNSARPAQLQALAYAQGTDIHVGPGQEKHLAHEAWHVVQQKQGRVQPTMQMKQGIPVNDDAGLESEADRMGALALTIPFSPSAAAVQPKFQASADIDTVQRQKVKIIGVKIGKTRIYNGEGTAVAHIAKGTEIDIDEGSSIVKGERTLIKINSGDKGIIWNKPDALLNNADDLWISQTRYTKAGGEDEAETEAPGLTVPLFGQELKLSTEGAELSGSIEKSISVPLPSVDLSVDFPLPVGAPVYVTVGLNVGLNLDLGVSGSYAAAVSSAGQKVTVNATANGKAGMTIGATLGAGVGLANIAGLEGGVFAEAASSVGVEGAIKGEVSRNAAKEWLSSSLELSLKSSASIVGKAGAYIKAKILSLSKTKKFTLLKKEFAKWEYERKKAISKTGLTIKDIVPTAADFKLMLTGDGSEYSTPQDEKDTTPLLGGGERSDS